MLAPGCDVGQKPLAMWVFLSCPCVLLKPFQVESYKNLEKKS